MYPKLNKETPLKRCILGFELTKTGKPMGNIVMSADRLEGKTILSKVCPSTLVLRIGAEHRLQSRFLVEDHYELVPGIKIVFKDTYLGIFTSTLGNTI